MVNIKKANKHDLIYLAGFFDGEGCILTQHQKSTRIKHSVEYVYKAPGTVRITVGQNDPAILYEFQNTFGGIIATYPKYTSIWRLNKKDELKKFLKSILPYLRGKKPQAELALKLLNLCGNRGLGVTKENLAKRRNLSKKIKSFKKKTLKDQIKEMKYEY